MSGAFFHLDEHDGALVLQLQSEDGTNRLSRDWGLAYLCSTATEAAPSFVGFERWAPPASTSRFVLSSPPPSGVRMRAEVSSAKP